MKFERTSSTFLIAIALSGCATVQYGDKETESNLRKLLPVTGKTSLYVCRESAAFIGAGNRTTVMVDSQPIGTLKPNNFAHTILDPGTHDIYIKRNPGGDSGTLTINSRADEVTFVWVGMTGGGFGVLTVDYFSNKREAERCVKGAEYAIKADS